MNKLDELIELEIEARNFGFEWPNIDIILEQVISECAEIKDAIENKTSHDVQEEIGDLIHTAISLCRFAGYDAKETLHKTVHKFSTRMNSLKIIALERGLASLKNQSPEFLLELWHEAKKRTKAK
jgi:uncharacterized protein YabN with tetrapyrrole methylase and pyrophosphatase domain